MITYKIVNDVYIFLTIVPILVVSGRKERDKGGRGIFKGVGICAGGNKKRNSSVWFYKRASKDHSARQRARTNLMQIRRVCFKIKGLQISFVILVVSRIESNIKNTNFAINKNNCVFCCATHFIFFFLFLLI